MDVDGRKWQPVGGQNFPANSKDLACPTSEDAPVENIGHFSELSNRHHSIAKTLRITLTLAAHRFTADGRMGAWLDFAKVLAVRLSDEERALLAYWALRTLSPEVRVAIMDGAHLGAVQ